VKIVKARHRITRRRASNASLINLGKWAVYLVSGLLAAVAWALLGLVLGGLTLWVVASVVSGLL
jgi:uncharacterized membrane protein